MTTFAEFVETITYKPGWTFRTHVSDFHSGVQLGIVAVVPDSNDPERMTETYAVHALSPLVESEPDIWKPFVWGCIMQMERHEMEEFLRFDGVRHKEPHPKPTPLPMPGADV